MFRINQQEPFCLYCGQTLGINEESHFTLTGAIEVVFNYKCEDCVEGLRITTIDDEYNNCIFTCKGICVLEDFRESQYGLTLLLKTGDEPVWIPEFKIDFSDREALYQKLKTYLTFS